ncbi:cysteine/glutathione ABC transporter ATP-binding protein/permease CydC [Veronia nyctiphanis]|uniref:Glutathione/L-cysteine transport system ATP-binding/permease protein CydC n=1 Tax=Veronia nyctiphanis TaxID=1278244 RepID=A0A4Q0YTU3_9GAMM|nr:cysteine/glutathione ABC transporter ATP-binding protein/permease CydC [Veronia nyctiphanis]RXJ73534.1 cysteine/glutathione ABC transporter ATP-binding protein/permease CydC [Veronia nyctiphanis]
MRDLLPFLRLYKKHWFGLTAGIVLALATLCSAIGLLTLSGWFIAASALAGLTIGSNFNYMLPAGGVRGFSIARTAGRWGERVVSHDATFKLLAELRIYFFRRLTPLIPGRIGSLRDADLLNRMVADVDAMDHVYLRLISPLIVGSLGIVAISSFLFWFEPSLGLTLGGILLTMMIALPIVFYRLGAGHGRVISQTKSTLRVSLLDWIQGQAELNIFGASQRYRQQAEDEQQTLLCAQRKMAGITGLASAGLLAANGLTLVLMLWLAADGIAGNKPDPFVAMVAFATMASFELMAPVAGAFQYLGQTITSAKRLNEVLQTPPDTPFKPDGYANVAKGKLTFSGVSYRYHGAEQDALSDVNLEVAAGKKIALLGRTGCGKSTLLQLITRNWDPQRGTILIDDVSLTEWQESALRKSIAVVSQRVDIFNGTLRNNLKMANSSASDDDFKEVLNQVGLQVLLEEPGLDMWLGDGGRLLSGGEKRRLSIARALLRNAPVLLLDEPTEGLDARTEQQILSLILEHAKNKTVVFITHRLIGLTDMDEICLMDEGRIIEQGSHQTLKAQNGRYSALLKRL